VVNTISFSRSVLALARPNLGALGFTDLTAYTAKAGYVQATYLLTGETRPAKCAAKVKHPVLGPFLKVQADPVGAPGKSLSATTRSKPKNRAGVQNGEFTQFTPGFVPS